MPAPRETLHWCQRQPNQCDLQSQCLHNTHKREGKATLLAHVLEAALDQVVGPDAWQEASAKFRAGTPGPTKAPASYDKTQKNYYGKSYNKT